MDIGTPEQWRWIWLITAVVFGVGEIAVAGSFFLAPFAVGAAVAAILAFAGVPVGVEWIAFVGVSVAAFAALRPIAKRLDLDGPRLGIGAHRQVGQRAQVIEAIDGEHHHGMVVLDREQWRAESDSREPIPVGATVVVLEVRGTRVVVAPVEQPGIASSRPGLPPAPPVAN